MASGASDTLIVHHAQHVIVAMNVLLAHRLRDLRDGHVRRHSHELARHDVRRGEHLRLDVFGAGP